VARAIPPAVTPLRWAAARQTRCVHVLACPDVVVVVVVFVVVVAAVVVVGVVVADACGVCAVR
jgi:hypothetical protein